MSRILVLVAHPDDETLSSGATLHKLSKEHEIFVACLTDAEEGYGEEGYQAGAASRSLYKATEVLGIPADRVMDRFALEAIAPELVTQARLRIRDMFVTDNAETMKLLIRIVRHVKPRIIITTHYNDFHTDHRALGRVMPEVAYQSGRAGIMGSVEEFEEPVVLLGEVDMENVTNMKTDIVSVVSDDDLKKKLEALECYGEYFKRAHPMGHIRIFECSHSRDFVYSLARLRGLHANVKYAEVFEIANYRPRICLETLL